jgi:hypothetical protein
VAGNTGSKEITMNNLKGKEPQEEPSRGFTPAEIADKIYYHPVRPPEGADANWVRCTLNSMARYKELPIGPSDWFERDEVERWVRDFGPDAILNAFREFLVDGSLS